MRQNLARREPKEYGADMPRLLDQARHIEVWLSTALLVYLLLSLPANKSDLGQSSFVLQELFSNCNLTDLWKCRNGDHTEHQ